MNRRLVQLLYSRVYTRHSQLANGWHYVLESLRLLYDTAPHFGVTSMTCRFVVLLLSVVASVFTTSIAAANIIHVPADQPTIQAGINAASNGDTVLVAPGTYNEDINFSGKAITVKSSGGSAVTAINGTSNGPVVQFVSGEGSGAVLRGFTIQNGMAVSSSSSFFGGGILVKSASPTIVNNVITGNQAASGGNGIAVLGGSPHIINNRITKNVQSPNFTLGTGGGGVLVTDTSSPTITGNTISYNSTTANGGGVVLYSVTGGAVLMNNTVSFNSGNDGGGLWIYNSQSVHVLQNIIVHNAGQNGGGLNVYPFQSTGFVAVNNTFAANSATDGSAVYVFGPDTGVTFFNNLLIGGSGFNAVACNGTGGSVFTDNDAYEFQNEGFAGTCADQSNVNGNISVDPLFVAKANYRLKGGSPAIDLGDNSAPHLPSKDFAGNPRIINGNDLSTAIVDMGAYEFVPVVLAPKSLSFGPQAVGSSTSQTVKLTNAQNKTLNISGFSVPTGYSVSGCGTSVAAFTSCSLIVTFHPLTSGKFKGTLSVTDDAGNSPQTVSLLGSAQ